MSRINYLIFNGGFATVISDIQTLPCLIGFPIKGGKELHEMIIADAILGYGIMCSWTEQTVCSDI